MKRISVCITGEDRRYGERFAQVVAIDHPGFVLILRDDCGDCREEADVCLISGAGRPGCLKRIAFTERGEETASVPKYAGVNAILAAIRRIAVERVWERKADAQSADPATDSQLPPVSGTIVCLYSFSGGVGTSAAAIGIAREMARYRDKRALYLSLEETESRAFAPPEHAGSMCAEAFLFHYLRLKRDGATAPQLRELTQSAFRQDGYGVYRLGPDAGLGSLSGLEAGKLIRLLADVEKALSVEFFVLDFGTRVRSLQVFLDLCEAFCVEVRSAAKPDGMQARLFEMPQAVFVNPPCPEDVRDDGQMVEISIANAFGLAVKETCDRILGEEN